MVAQPSGAVAEKPNSAPVQEDVPPSSHDTSEGDKPELPALRFSILALSLCLGLFLSFIDTSIVATGLFAIGTDFGDLERVNWVAISYTLAYMGFAVFFARISDIVGRRNAFLGAFFIFFAFSIGCGFAQTMDQLIACRTLQGIGGSGLYSLTMIILLEVSPLRFRTALASIIGMVLAVGGVLGPVLGGILTHYATWRWVFWINGPIGAVSGALFYFAWPEPAYLPRLQRRKWSELDYPGSFLLIAASTLVVFPFQNAGSVGDAWGRAVFLAPLIAGIACWMMLIAWTAYSDRKWGDKLAAAFPMRMMVNRPYAATILNAACIGFAFIMPVYAFPLRLQVVNGKSALLAGVMLLPLLGASAVGSMLAGAINSKKDWICETLVVSSCLTVLGCGLLSTQSSTVDVEPKALGFLVFVGLGFGMSAASATMLANIRVATHDQAPAQGILSQMRILGGSLGIAASSAVLGRHLKDVVDPMALASIEHHTGNYGEDQRQAVSGAYSAAFNEDMHVCAIVGSVGILLAFGVWTRKRQTIQELRNKTATESMGRA